MFVSGKEERQDFWMTIVTATSRSYTEVKSKGSSDPGCPDF
jgi:hypothetical protein